MKDLPLLKRCVTNQNRSPRADSRADGGKETICPVVSQWSGWTTWDLTSSVSQNVWRRRAAGGVVDGGWIPYLSGGGLVVRGVWPLSVPSPPASRRRPLRRSRREKASAGRKLLQANSRFATRSRCLGHGIADVWSSSGRFRYQSSSTFPVWKGGKRNLVDPIGYISTRVLMGRQVLTGPI